MATKISGRALHYVFKVADLEKTSHFYRDILGMKVLRHEDFGEGCEAACNGPYANRWCKTMIGYGSEDTHFVIELTYNYTVDSYKKGNDFISITIKSKEVLERAKAHNWPILDGNVLEAPGGYKYFIKNEPQPTDKDPVERVTLACSDITRTIQYWHETLGLALYEQRDDSSVLLGFKDDQAKIEFNQLSEPIDRGTAYGRIAFSCPYDQQPLVDEKIKKAHETILTPLLTLPTPGKQTVRVIILADPDGHEICFVEDEGFRKLSEPDVNGAELLDKQLKELKLD